mgnify:CR=1 FL=1
MDKFKEIIINSIKFYQIAISPFLGTNCRFVPTCSEYCQECFRNFGFCKAIYLCFSRIIKCHPLGSHGYDPVSKDFLEISETISLKFLRKFRKSELYRDLPQKFCVYKADEIKTTKHFVLLNNGELTSALTLVFTDLKKNVQIRGMFTRRKFIGRGYGKFLLLEVLAKLKSQKYCTVWCNARSSVIGFYKSSGFKISSSFFYIKPIGLHKKLTIKL